MRPISSGVRWVTMNDDRQMMGLVLLALMLLAAVAFVVGRIVLGRRRLRSRSRRRRANDWWSTETPGEDE